MFEENYEKVRQNAQEKPSFGTKSKEISPKCSEDKVQTQVGVASYRDTFKCRNELKSTNYATKCPRTNTQPVSRHANNFAIEPKYG